MPSSWATDATPSGIPIPRFTIEFMRSDIAARRAITLRGVSGRGSNSESGMVISPE